jgi:hypothetical protein
VKVEEASVKEAQAEAERSRLLYQSEMNGINTNVVKASLELKEADAAAKQAQGR